MYRGFESYDRSEYVFQMSAEEEHRMRFILLGRLVSEMAAPRRIATKRYVLRCTELETLLIVRFLSVTK